MRRRRAYLRLFGAGAVGAVAGCSGGGSTDETTERASATGTTTSEPDGESETQTDADGRSISPQQRAKLAAEDGRPGDSFGVVALSDDGSTALVGAPSDDTTVGGEAGSAYVFRDTGASGIDDWTQAAKLFAEDGGTGANMGFDVAISADGSTAIVGAPLASIGDVFRAGVAYVFTSAGGTWTQQARLRPSEPAEEEWSGSAVALSADGETALVGAPEAADGRGSAYVYTRTGTTWARQTTLSVGALESDMWFGRSLALADGGDVAVVGACSPSVLNDDGDDGDDDPVGRVYQYVRREGAWSQPQRLTASGADRGDQFGGNVVTNGSGTTLLVGAHRDSMNGPDSGSVYVFTRQDDRWFQEAKLTADDGDADDYFGGGLALDGAGTTALVGAWNDEDPNGEGTEPSLSGAGSAYVFTAAGGEWTQAAKFAPEDGDSYDGFGSPLSLTSDGTRALLGSTDDEDPNGETETGNGRPVGAGSAYVFEL